MFFLYNIELTNDQDTEYNSIILSMHGDNI